MPTPTAPAEGTTFTDTASAYAEDRESQSAEALASIEADLADESPLEDEGEAEGEEGEAPAPKEGEAEVEAAKPVKQEEAAEYDSLANAKPINYTVDGQSKSYDGIRVLSDKDGTIQGGIIPAEAMKDVQYRLQRGEYLETQNKTLYNQTQALDHVTFKMGDGQEVKGMAAVEQFAIENARLAAGARVLASVLESDLLIDLAIARDKGDTKEFQRLTRDLRAEVRDAEHAARTAWGQRTQAFQQESTSQENVASQTATAITTSVSTWSQRYPTLSKDDIADVTRHLTSLGSALVHPATPEQAAQAGVRPGELVIHNEIVDETLKARAALIARYQGTNHQQNAVAQENARRLAAATQNRGNGKKPAQKPTQAQGRAAPPKKSKSEEWQDQKLQMMAGRHSAEAASDDE